MEFDFGASGIGSTYSGSRPVATTTGRHTTPLHVGHLRRRYRPDFASSDLHARPPRLETNTARRHRTEPWPTVADTFSGRAIDSLPSIHSLDTIVRGARPIRRRYGSDLDPEGGLGVSPRRSHPLRGRNHTDSLPVEGTGFRRLRHRPLYDSEPALDRNDATTTGFRPQFWPDDPFEPLLVSTSSSAYNPAFKPEVQTSCSLCGSPMDQPQVGRYCFCDACSHPLRPAPSPTCAAIARILPERIRAWQLAILVFIWCLLLSFMGWYTKSTPLPGRLAALMSAAPRDRAMGFGAIVLLVAKSYDVFVETPPAVTARQYTFGAMIISRTVRSLLIGLQMHYLASFIYLVVWIAGLRTQSELFLQMVSTFMLHLVMDFDPRRVADLYLYVILGVMMALVNGSFFTVFMSMLVAWSATPRWSDGDFMVPIRQSVGLRVASAMLSAAGWVWYLLLHVLFTMLIVMDVLSIGVEFWHLRYDWYQHVTPWGLKAGGMVVVSAGTTGPEMTMV